MSDEEALLKVLRLLVQRTEERNAILRQQRDDYLELVNTLSSDTDDEPDTRRD